MRFAISAVAAGSGLVLLGLAFYGQPAVYLRQAGEQWDALMDRPVADQRAEADAEADSERAARLQGEVARLEAELAARQAVPASPPVTAALPGLRTAEPGVSPPGAVTEAVPTTTVTPDRRDAAAAVAAAKA